MPKKILVIEKDASLQDVISMVAESCGWEKEGQLNAHTLLAGNAQHPDVILLRDGIDLDGLAICRQLKQKATTSNIPVVIMSAIPEHRQQALQAGAVSFIDMPFNLEALRTIFTY